MSTSASFKLSSVYSELSRACSTQSYQKAVTLSTKILSKYPTEHKALQCKVVALIRLEKYEECLSVLKKFPEYIKCVLFEKAYAEYRLHRIEDSAKTLSEADDDDLRVLELKAQVLYRKEKFHDAYTYLRNVLRSSQDDFNEERLTNLVAIVASSACFVGENLDIDINPVMFEANFNLACHSIGLGNINTAETLLTDAERICREAFADDPEITDEEINGELAPIRVQQAYLLHRAGKEDVANQMYQSIVRNRFADSAVVAVAANNIVCVNKEQNIFDSRKRIKMTSIEGVQHKLFAKQREDMLINQALFYWYTNQIDACQAKVKTVLQMNPSCSRATLLLAAQFLREKQYDRAVAVLQTYCEQSESQSGNSRTGCSEIEVILALAQLRLRDSMGGYLTGGCLPKPTNALAVASFLGEKLPNSQLHSPGMVSTRIALYMLASVGDQAVLNHDEALKKAGELVQSALDWYESRHTEDASYTLILDRCANFFLQHGQPELAALLFERRLARLIGSSDDRDDSTIKQALVARLVRAYAQFDRPRAEAACRFLQFKDVISEPDVDSMETAFLYGVKALKRQGRAVEQPSSAESKPHAKTKHVNQNTPRLASTGVDVEPKANQGHRKKKRKVRLPKNYQPGVMPDPDRWLPRRERAQYRGKRRDKRHPTTTRGPQGQVTGGSEWDASVRSPKGATPSSPATTETTESTPKQHGGPNRQHPRKNRKKRR